MECPRENSITPEVQTLVDQLKSVAPKDRKKVGVLDCYVEHEPILCGPAQAFLTACICKVLWFFPFACFRIRRSIVGSTVVAVVSETSHL